MIKKGKRHFIFYQFIEIYAAKISVDGKTKWKQLGQASIVLGAIVCGL